MRANTTNTTIPINTLLFGADCEGVEISTEVVVVEVIKVDVVVIVPIGGIVVVLVLVEGRVIPVWLNVVVAVVVLAEVVEIVEVVEVVVGGEYGHIPKSIV
jgi:hypothetical protein